MGVFQLLVVGVASLSLSVPAGITVLASAPAPSVQSIVAGQTVFLANATVANIDKANLLAIDFSVVPKQGSVTKAIHGTYSANYLATHGLLNSDNKSALIPIYGLYQGRLNQLTFTVKKKVGRHTTSTSLKSTFTTQAWDNGSSSSYTHPTTVVPRNNAVALGYSFFMLKAWSIDASPVVMDTDGEVRWVGSTSGMSPGATYFHNGFYVGQGSTLRRIELDGSVSTVADYSSLGYHDFHHNIDYGRSGMLIDFNHDSDLESDIAEVTATGTVVTTWDFAKIISDAITANGEDPSAFVRHGDDWFHNNAATYWAQKNEIVVSSRENFVIGIGYDSKKIHWILGDPTKKWHEFAALRKFALTMTGAGIAPVGEHAVSITADNKLLLFDNGTGSYAHNPAGVTRGYAAARKYSLNLTAKTATEVWNFEHGQSVYSPICSSIYQDNGSYLIDYASENWGADIRLVGLDQRSRVAFEFTLAGYNWEKGWNALPIHLENTVFSR